MLPADHRLRDSDAFRRTVRSGRRAGSAALVLHLLEAPSDRSDPSIQGSEGARVGFVVTKALGNAVVRNRVRRRLRHLVMEHLALLPPGSELVVRALPAAATLGSVELGLELTRCLERVLRSAPAAAARTGAAT